MALTEFGRVVRKARIDADVTLGQMADELKVSPAFLSGLETGRKRIPAEWIEKIESYFRSRDVIVSLGVAADVANGTVSLDGLNSAHQVLVAGFARGSFNEQELERIRQLLSNVNGAK